MSNIEPPETKAATDDGWFSRTVKIAQIGVDTFVEQLPIELSKSEGGRTVLDAAQKTKDVAGRAYDGAVEAGGKLIDNISGAEATARIEELLAGQRRYNDILATRLAEALDRIEALEAEVKRLSDGRR